MMGPTVAQLKDAITDLEDRIKYLKIELRAVMVVSIMFMFTMLVAVALYVKI